MIILEDLNFEWDNLQIQKFIELWNLGFNLFDIADCLNRPYSETFLLGMHLDLGGRIKQRKGYLWGCNDADKIPKGLRDIQPEIKRKNHRVTAKINEGNY